MDQQTAIMDEDVEKGESFCTICGNADWRRHYGNNVDRAPKVKNGSAFWPSDPTSGNLSKGIQNTNLEEYKHSYVHYSVTYNHQDMEAAQVSISRWVDTITIGHQHNGILLGSKRGENFILCDSMDGPGEYYAKWNKPVREGPIPYSFNDMWNLMNKLN